MKAQFEFDAVTHIYKLGGVKIHSHSVISNLLFGAGCYPKDDTLPMDRGSYIHDCCEKYLLGTLDIEVLIRDGDDGWIVSLRKGLYTIGILGKKVYAEIPTCSYKHRYGVKPDAVFPDQKTIVEFKTGEVEKERHAMQLMAQRQAVLEFHDVACDRLVILYLKPDGTFKKSKIYRFNARMFSVFQSGIVTWNCQNKRIKFDL